MDSKEYHVDPGVSTERANETFKLVPDDKEPGAAMLLLQLQIASLVAAKPNCRLQVFPVPWKPHRDPSSLNDGMLRPQLKKLANPKFLGVIKPEAVLLWTEAVTDFAPLAGLANNVTITGAWMALALRVLVWFKAMLEGRLWFQICGCGYGLLLL